MEEVVQAERNPRQVREEDKDVIDGWFTQAKACKDPEALARFVRHLLDDYDHDYGTICHAASAAAVAACWAIDGDGRQGGITGFQAGCIMWGFIRRWKDEEGPLRLVSYESMLYPQCKQDFDNVIDSGTWKYLQEEATRKLDESPTPVHSNVAAHWQSIVDGTVPFGFSVRD